MSAVAIIPARGGSRRIPRKNIRMFHGKPIIAFSIEAAQRSALFDRIVVSTEDREIAEICYGLNAWVVFRPAHLDDVGTQELMTQTAGLFDAQLYCCIYATAPLMSSRDIVRAHAALNRVGALFAFAVGADPLRDAGQFYWSRATALLTRKDLVGEHSVMVPIAEKRVIDINVEADWLEAERKYEALAPWERNA